MTTEYSSEPTSGPQGLMRSAGRLSGARILNVIASFAGAVLVTRELGPSDRGVYSLVTTISALAVLLFTIGMPAAITWQVARGNALTNLRWVFVGIPLFALFAASVFLMALHDLAGKTAYGSVPIVASCLLVGALSVGALLRAVLTGLHEYSTLSQLLSVYAITTAVSTALAAVITKALQPTLYVAVGSACVVYAWYLFRLRSTWRSLPRRASAPGGETRRFAGLSWVTNIVQQVNFSFGLLLLGAFESTREVGFYAAATAMAQVLWLIPSAASEIAFAEAARQTHMSQGPQFRMLTGRYLWTVATITAAGALVMWPLSYVVVPFVLGAKFEDAITPLLLLLPGVVGFSIAQVGGNTIAGRGRVRLNLVTSLASVVVTMGCGLFLIPTWGAEGAAVTNSASYLIATLFTLIFIRRISREDSNLSGAGAD